MKVVALVSGGKDSCYAMMRCVDYGHEIVALANLLPLEDSIDELDSYMYQTVGHQIVVTYAECMGLPLFRRRIKGSTRHTNLSYKATSGDEVEDMHVLLKAVKEKFPSVTAVSSGAIASDYQRLRVESVCSRLGLVSLAYLWKQDQTLLLQEMVEKGIAAITVKVAAMGLIPAEHLGKEIAQLQDQLLDLKELYGINVCGEGGEYETLTLDCPLFKHARIVLDNYQIVLHSANSIAPVGVLHPLAFHVESKQEIPSICNSSNESIDHLERRIDIHEVLDDMPKSPSEDHAPNPCTTKDEEHPQISSIKGCTFTISSWNSPASTNGLKEDLTFALTKIESQLAQCGFGWSNVLYIHLYISDMNKFSVANEVYLQFITENKCHFGVPSRSTVELPLQPGLGNAYMEVLVSTDCCKKVLHVQSISCWAPSCIGPYSQATLHKEILYMAGQLGLDPPTMNLCSGGPVAELDQALANCEAVARSFNASLVSSTILLVIYCSSLLTPPDSLEVYQRVLGFFSEKDAMSNSSSLLETSKPIFLYVLVPALPKSALLEVKPLLYVPVDQEMQLLTSNQNDTIMEIPPEFDLRELNVNLSSEKYIVSGKICLAMISIVYNDPEVLHFVDTDRVASDIKIYGTEKHISVMPRVLVFGLNRTILESGFSWIDMTSLRIYFATTFCEAADTLRTAFSEAFGELFQTNDDINIPKEFDFALIPVLSAGHSSKMSNLITCELFASKVVLPLHVVVVLLLLLKREARNSDLLFIVHASNSYPMQVEAYVILGP